MPSTPSTSRPLPNGTIVRVLADSTIAELCWHSADEAHIVHGDRSIGRGPWIMRPTQVVEATAAERADYYDRVTSLLTLEGRPERVIASVQAAADRARAEVQP
jgi:hypothetical protein